MVEVHCTCRYSRNWDSVLSVVVCLPGLSQPWFLVFFIYAQNESECLENKTAINLFCSIFPNVGEVNTIISPLQEQIHRHRDHRSLVKSNPLSRLTIADRHDSYREKKKVLLCQLFW